MADIDSGYIKLHRSMLQWQWHDMQSMLSVFLHCLLLANWRTQKWHGEVIERGSFVTSYQILADTCGISTNTCRACCKRLQETGELILETSNKGTKITVKNYDRYQDSDDEECHAVQSAMQLDMQSDVQLDMQPLHINLQNNLHTTEEVKKERSKEVLDIVSFLNETVHASYKPNTPKTKSLITARLNEGFTVDDFKTVIQKKADEWLGDDKMQQYLRPSTLFGTKFEAYLNQKPVQKQMPDWYTAEPVRQTEAVPATEAEIEATRRLLQKGMKN